MTREQHEPADPPALDETTAGPIVPSPATPLTASAVAADTELLRVPPPRPASGTLRTTLRPRPDLDATSAPSRAFERTEAGSGALDETRLGGPVGASEATVLRADMSFSSGGEATAAALQAVLASGRIGRFLVLRELGRGAMGVVFAAYDEELDRKVAIKLLHASRGDQASHGRAMLLREAQAMARLAHPNVVAVHEVGVVEGAVFVAMEYVAGADLQAWLADKQRPWREVVAALRQAGAGLVAAHREGLIHRDFKPSNVLVGDDGRVRVADFGLAARRGAPRERGDVASTVAPMTATLAPDGALVGTPAYMAPELLRGGSASAASDQFAFCVALYEALYGRRPFQGDTLASLTEDVERRPLPAAPLLGEVPAWLHAAVCRGLSKKPGDRFPALDELVELLARDPEAEQAQMRKRARQFAAAVAGTAALVALVVFAWDAIGRLLAERQAERRLDVLRNQLAELRARGEDDEARRLLRSFVELPDNRGLPVIARAYLEWAAAQTDHAAAVDAYGSAYVNASAHADAHAALRGLVDRLYAGGRVPEAAAALAVLGRDAPDEAAAPELQPVRLAAALARRDLPAARDVLAQGDPAAWSPVLEHLSQMTEFSDDHFGGPDAPDRLEFAALDTDLDGALEIVASPNPADVRVLHADASLTPVRAVPLPATPRNFVPLAAVVPGESLWLANYPTDRPQQFELRLYAQTAGGPPRLVDAWPDSVTFHAVTVDLDGDGAREIYLGTEAYTRKLWRLDRAADGTWTRRPAHPPTDAATSDLTAVLVADFGADGRRELVVAAGPWKAYDLRVYEPTAAGGLDQIARKAFGAYKTTEILHRRDGDLVAFLKADFQVAPGRFPPDRPLGEPAGVYVAGPQDGTLAVHAFLARNVEHGLSFFHTGDLDGDGDDEIAIESGPDTVLLRYRPGEPLHPLRLSGVRVLLLHDLDGDGRAEMLARPSDRPGYLLLGAGDTPLPPLPPVDQGPRPIPPGLADPAIAQAWQHAEQLVAIGLPARTAAELSAIARLSGHVAPDMLFRAAELYGGLGDDAAAAEHYVAAATRPDLADPALAAAAAARRRLGEFSAAAELTRRRLDTVDPAARPAVEAELAELTAATAERPQFAADFTRPLDPRWRIANPVAIRRDLGRRELAVWAEPGTVLAELPLAWDGGPAALEVELAGDPVEWGAEIAVSVVGPDDKQWLSARVNGVGVSDKPRIQYGAWASEDHPAEAILGPARTRVGVEVYPALQTAILAINDDRLVRPAAVAAFPPAGPLRLQIRARLIQPGYVARAAISSLRLRGFTVPDEPPGPADPAHLLAEGQLADVLAALGEPAPASERQLWRIDALLALGRIDAAAREIAALLAVDDDFGPAHLALVQRLRRGDDAATMAARAAFGPRLVDLYLEPRLAQALRPGDIAPVLAGLPPTDPAAAPADPRARQRLVQTELARGLALTHVGRFAAAQQAYTAALARVDAGADFPIREQQRWRLLGELLIVATATADRDAALKCIDRTLAESPTPYLALDRMQADPALTRLVGPDTWTALNARLRAERP